MNTLWQRRRRSDGYQALPGDDGDGPPTPASRTPLLDPATADGPPDPATGQGAAADGPPAAACPPTDALTGRPAARSNAALAAFGGLLLASFGGLAGGLVVADRRRREVPLAPLAVGAVLLLLLGGGGAFGVLYRRCHPWWGLVAYGGAAAVTAGVLAVVILNCPPRPAPGAEADPPADGRPAATPATTPATTPAPPDAFWAGSGTRDRSQGISVLSYGVGITV